MIIFPAIDIKDGVCVRLVKGDFRQITSYENTPIDQANEFSNLGFNNIHIVDLDGALYGRPVNSILIREIIKKVKLKVEKLGEMDTELFKEWFQAFSEAAGITLHIENIYGDNSHHIIESCFKGLAHSLRQALEIDKRIKNKIPSTKGTL